MGYFKHHYIVVTAWNETALAEAHAKATEIFGWASPISPRVVNSYASFFVPPDGSKEGWDASNDGDIRRAQFKEWMRSTEFEDGSCFLCWAEIGLGEERTDRAIEDFQGKRQRKLKAG